MKPSDDEDVEQPQSLRITLASIGDAVISTDAAGCVTFMSGLAQHLTGWSHVEALGKPLAEIFHVIDEQTRQPIESLAHRALREGVPLTIANHTVLIARDGTERPIEDRAAPMRDGNGPVVGAVVVFRDVTERRRGDEDRARLAAIVESSDDAIISKSLDGVILTWNAGAERIFGYTQQEAIGKPVTLIIPVDRYAEERKILERLRRGERVDHFETLRLTKSGQLIDVSLTISPLRDVQGHIIGAAKIARDITDRKRAESILRESEGRHRFLGEFAAVTQSLTEPTEIMSTAARVLAEHLGVDRCAYAEIEDETSFVITGDHPIGVASIVGRWPVRDFGAECTRSMLANQPYVVTDVDSDPRLSPADLAAYRATQIQAVICVPLHKEGKFTAAMAVHQKTPRSFTKAEVQLVQTVADRCWESIERARVTRSLRAADRKKDIFIALLAHELRNPLAPIRNGLQIMQLAGGDTKAAERARAMMDRQLSHMVRLIDDLLDVSRINRNKMDLRRSRVVLADVLNSALETTRPLIDAERHALHVSLPRGPVYLDADLTRLAQVFSNLLTNSAKYTESGGHIWLSAERHGSEVVVAVRDSGIGIPHESLGSIFDMFAQLDRPIERTTGGLGIGLALVKGLVEMHGGTVKAESSGANQGSTFTVTLPTLPPPIEPSGATPTPSLKEPPGPRRRILVVDDNRDGADSLSMMLRLLHNDVQIANDGLEAIERADTFRPHLILMDLGMPRLNGYEATRRIRGLPFGGDIKIIALSGWGQEGDRVRSQEAGCDGHLVKPISLTELQKLLGEVTFDANDANDAGSRSS